MAEFTIVSLEIALESSYHGSPRAAWKDTGSSGTEQYNNENCLSCHIQERQSSVVSIDQLSNALSIADAFYRLRDDATKLPGNDPYASRNFRQALVFVCTTLTNTENSLVGWAGEVALLEVMVS
jgi:hypothetical protein